MRRFLREQGLSLFFLALFLGSLVGQAIAGHKLYNEDEITHAALTHDQPDTISLGRYLVSSSFGNAVMENWQSEYLQFVTFLIATVWLVQRGAAESKEPGHEGRESDEEQEVGRHARPDSPRWAGAGGVAQRLYENSLLVVMGLIWIGSWFAQSVTGWSEYNSEQLEHQDHVVSYAGYLTSSSFWEATLQNWQS